MQGVSTKTQKQGQQTVPDSSNLLIWSTAGRLTSCSNPRAGNQPFFYPFQSLIIVYGSFLASQFTRWLKPVVLNQWGTSSFRRDIWIVITQWQTQTVEILQGCYLAHKHRVRQPLGWRHSGIWQYGLRKNKNHWFKLNILLPTIAKDMYFCCSHLSHSVTTTYRFKQQITA